MADQDSRRPIPPEPGETPEPNEPPRNFTVDLTDGLDEALKKLRDRASHYYKKGQHTQVRVKFRGREIATLPLTMMVAVEAATFWWAGPLRLIVANALGKTFLEVEFINEADNIVTAGKQRLLDGELDEALAKFREALEMDRQHAGAYLNLGIAQKLKGEREECLQAFEKAAALDPNGETGKEARRQIEKLKPRAG
jgi:tetratricopeptide (TPR) repeat protein